MIRLRGVSRTYTVARGADVDALKDVDLVVERGEFVAIIGPSGGGKTTLMNILGLLDAPTAGEYELAGERVNSRADRAAAQVRARTIGFIFQAFHLLEGRPAIDSAELNLLYRGRPRPERRERARRALEAVGLGDRAEQSTSTLSGGQRQRVAIARATASAAPLILADEPTGNLDSRTASQVLDELQRLNDNGATVVIVTHAAEVAARARRTVRIMDGRVVSDSGKGEAGGEDARPAVSSGDAALADEPEQHHARSALGDVVRDAWASVWSRTTQSAGQLIAVAIAVGLTITTLGLSASASAQVAATFDAHLNREVTAYWSTGAPHAPSLEESPAIAERLSGVESAALMVSLGPGTVSTFAEARQVRSHIAFGDIAAAARLAVTEAPWHTGALKSDEALVGDLLAKDLRLGSIAETTVVSIDGTEYVVAGIITESSRLPLLRGEAIVGSPDQAQLPGAVDATLLTVTAAGAAPQVARQLPPALNPFARESITVHAPTDSAQLRGEIEQGVRITLAAFTLLALIVAVVALTNSSLLAVNARRGEIGMRKALGARDHQIAALLTWEAGLIGLSGGVVGLLLGMCAILAVTIGQRWTPVFDLLLLPVALGSGLIVGAGGGGLAAVRAARLRPAENLRA